MSKDKTQAPAPSTAMTRLDPQALISTAIEKGAGIETLERLVALAKDVRAVQAKEAWLHAMAEFQETCPKISRSRKASISTRTGGSYSYTYAPLAEIMSKIQPVLGPLGLSVSFRVSHAERQVIAVCQVAHEMGHQESSGEVAMPFDQGDGTGANPAQRVGIASTYAKRYALLAILGIAPEDDTDARADGKPEVEMPRRASEAAPPGRNAWRGKVASVKEKSGTTNGKKWTLFTVTGSDGLEFGTFDTKEAEFARQAGTSEVDIVWEETAKGSKKIIAIQPANEAQEDEGPDA